MLTSVISIDDVAVLEGDMEIKDLIFTVTRTGTSSGDLNSNVSIDFSTQDDTASTADNDYISKSGTLNFSADATLTEQTQTLTIQVYGDFSLEDNETFQVLLSSNAPDITILKDTGIATIFNNDFRRVDEVQILTPPAPVSEDDYFGNEIAIDGNFMVVGVASSDLVATDAGAAFIYYRDNQGTSDETDDTWAHHSTLTAFDAASEDHFGTSVAIHGDTVVIGADNADLQDIDYGAAYVYRLTGSVWTFEEKLIASDGVKYDRFGNDVAIENDTIVIGASYRDLSYKEYAGTTYIFTRTGNSWSQSQQLTISDGERADYFGHSVAIHNNEIFVSATRADPYQYGPDTGLVYVFQNIENSWSLNQKLVPIDGQDEDRFGLDLKVDGNYLAIISKSNSRSYDSGQVYLFENNNGTWEFQQKIEPSTNDLYSLDLASLDLSGTTLVVGSVYPYGSFTTSGTATVFQLIGDDWVETQVYSGGILDRRTYFGSAVALASSQIIVGASETNSLVEHSGQIHVLGQFSPGFVISDIIKSEGDSGDTQFQFTIERKGNTAGDLNIESTIDFTTVDGTATVTNGDYQAQNGRLTFNADPAAISQTQIITIIVNGDEIYESLENFYVLLSNPSSGFTLIDPQGEARIVEDDYATVRVTESEVTVNEADGIAQLTVSLDRVFSEDVVVRFSYEANSARLVDDFGFSSFTATIPAGQLSTTFSINIVEDNIPEDEEQFWIYLHGGTNYRAGSFGKTVVKILNDDFIEISIDDAVVNENQSYVDLYVTASKPVNLPILVHYTTQDNTAISPNDYTAVTDGYVEFGGFQTSGPIRIPIVNQPEWELDESFFVNLTHVTGYNIDNPPVVFIDDQAEVTIIDDDRASISINDITVDENAGSVNLTVSLDRPVDSAVSVDFATANQTATDPEDYLAASGTLTLGAGEQSKTITISIVDSDFVELDEAFLVNLTNIQANGQNIIFADDQAEVTIIDDEVVTAEVNLRAVNTPTSTDPEGVAAALPDNQDGIGEWSTYWVEIWVNANSPANQGIFSAQLDLNYNTEYTSATEIEFGAGFTQNQAGIIDDTLGKIEGLYAETTLTNLGAENHLLFARVKFESLAEDQIKLDLSGKSIGPHDLGFQVNLPQVKLVNAIPITTHSGQFNGVSMWANPYDLNDNDVIDFDDLTVFVSTYNSIPSESDSNYAWFADLNKNDKVDFDDLVLFVVNYSKSKLDQTSVIYPKQFPEAWSNLLTVNAQTEPQPEAEPITQSTAEMVLEDVVEQVSPDLTAGEVKTLENTEIQVVDLQDDLLGRAVPGTIYIDVNAAGYGWFVDSTPGEHSEFEHESQLSLIALPDSEAAGKIDLWTVIMHEVGHILGHEHEDKGIMEETLAPGVRKLPFFTENDHSLHSENETDEFFTSLKDDSNLITF